MNANAFCDIWAGVMFFKCSELLEPHELRERSYHFSFLIFSTKLLKKKEKKKSTKRDRQAALVTQLCSGFQTASSHVLFEPINYNLVLCKLSVNSF